jgi:hypothetical protein
MHVIVVLCYSAVCFLDQAWVSGAGRAERVPSSRLCSVMLTESRPCGGRCYGVLQLGLLLRHVTNYRAKLGLDNVLDDVNISCCCNAAMFIACADFCDCIAGTCGSLHDLKHAT